MEDQTPTDFMVMRRKRRNPSSLKKGRHAQSDSRTHDSTGSMSSFIQSALLITDSHATPEHPHLSSAQLPRGSDKGSSCSGKKTWVRSGSKMSGANISAKKSISGANKKLKLDVASRNWDMLMTAKWPDQKDSTLSHSDESDIDSYSDAKECATQLEDGEIDSDDIHDQTSIMTPPTPRLPSSTRLLGDSHVEAGKKRQHVRGLKKLQTSTPLYQHQEQKKTSDDDFDSRSSDSDHCLVDQSHSLQDFILSTTKAVKNSSGLLPRPIFNAADCSDTLDIVSLPSSPDEPSTILGTDLNRTKTSDWVKQLHMESKESNQSHDMHCTLNETMKTPHDSAKKTTRGRKLVVGGLAEQLQRLIKRESSEITFWEHKAKKLDEMNEDFSNCLTVHVLSLMNCYSLFVATCRVLQGKTQPQTPHAFSAMMEHSPMTDISEPSSPQNRIAPSLSLSQYPNTICSRPTVPVSDSGRCSEAPINDNGTCSSKLHKRNDRNETVTVFFSQRSAKHLGLCVGSHIRIHPPWQCLHLPTLSQDVILCTHFCQLVGHTHVLTDATPTSPVPCKQKGVTGVYSVLSTEKNPLSAYSMLTRSPMKGLVPTRLFADDASVSEKSRLSLGATAMENSVSSYDTVMDTSHYQPCCTTQANVPVCLLLGALEYAHDGVLSAVSVRVLRVYRRKMACGVNGGTREEKWSLLLCDTTQTFAELLVPDYNSNSQWCDLVRRGQSKAVTFTNLKLTKKTNAARNPELFSLIQSLNGQLSMPFTANNCKSTDDATTTRYTQLATPISCYILRTQADSEILDCNDNAQLPQLVEQLYLFRNQKGNGSCGDSSERQPTPSRVSLLARVAHTHIEVPLLPNEDTDPSIGTLPISTTYQCGYYLFVVTPTHCDISKLLRLYLKTGFSVRGLEKVLVTPSTEVLLRDVRCSTLEDGDIHHSMDACSLIIPVSCQDPDLVYPTMPPSMNTKQLSTLSHLSTPHLPTLSPTTAAPATLVNITDGCVVGVDEENAYSWPVCDKCSSEKLGSEEDTTSELYCEVCQRVVMSPAYQMQLSVLVSTNQLTVLVQLLQATIHWLLPVSTTNINLGFDVHCILNKAISLKSCYILGIQDTESGDSILTLEEVDVTFPT